MKTFHISGRCLASPPPEDWRDELARMLGTRPRRIGNWAELGLYGALRCMADAGEETLDADARLWLGSRSGTFAATAAVLEQMRDDLPMPLAFLQTQPSQLLAQLAAQLGWNGDACFAAGSDMASMLRLAATGKAGVLLGWVDDKAGAETHWLRLRPCADVEGEFAPLDDRGLLDPGLSHLAVDASGRIMGLSGPANLGARGARC